MAVEATRRMVLLLVTAAIAFAVLIWTPAAKAEPRIKVECSIYDTNRVDPIVLGSGHLHRHFGNTSTTDSSTGESLKASQTTSCDRPWFTSGAWFPVEREGYVVTSMGPEPVDVYYRAPGDQRQIRPIPTGLEIVADDEMYQCIRGSLFQRTPPYGCKNKWNTRVIFFDCYSGSPVLKWNSANWRNSRGGVCPQGFDYRIPKINYLIHHLDTGRLNRPLEVSAGVDSSEDYDHMHADYLAANQDEFNDELLDLCLRDAPDSVLTADPVKCGEIEG